MERHGPVTVLSFTRPPRNFMSFASMQELGKQLEALAGEDSVSLVVLTGGLPGYFVAHADLEDLSRIGRGQPVDGDPRSWFRTLALIESMPQPVVAAINGQAWGGGCEIAIACAIRVAARSAHLGQPEIAVGIIPGGGGTQRLPRLVGPGRAAEMIMSGRVLEAGEAHTVGLVDVVLPDEDFLRHTLDWLEPIAGRSRAALLAAKRAIFDGLKLPLNEGLKLEGRYFLELQAGPDALHREQEALSRYATASPEERVSL
jgi:enoyl-CoA hydratase